MTRKRVDSTKSETEGERALANGIADTGPKVETVMQSGRTNATFGSQPYDPSKSIDRTFTLDGS